MNDSHQLREVRTRAAQDAGVDCDHVEGWLSGNRGENAAVPAENAVPAEIRAHLEGCNDCRVEQSELLQLVMEPVASTPDPLFVRSVMAQVRREPAPLRRQRRSTLRFRAAALLAILLLPASAFLVATIDSQTDYNAEPGLADTARMDETTASGTDVVADGMSANLAMSVKLDDWQTGYDRGREDARPTGGWIPALRGDEGSREIVSF